MYNELITASECYTKEKAELQSKLVDYMDKLVQDIPYEMITNDLDLDLIRMFKMLDVKLEPQCNTVLERLVEYVKVLSRLLGKTLLILTNICSYLDDYDIRQLKEICAYNKINMLFLESHEHTFENPVDFNMSQTIGILAETELRFENPVGFNTFQIKYD